MPMTHIPETSAENRHEKERCPICYGKPVPEKYGCVVW